MNTNQENLKQDPRILQAKKLIQDALADHQKVIKSPLPAIKQKIVAYEKQLKKMNHCRGGNLFYPYLASGFGHGPYVELEDGSIKLDFISGIGVHYFGHQTESYVNAHFDAIFSSTIMQGHLQQQSNSLELLELALKAANKNGAKLSHGVISSSGAMANENALKLAYSHKKGCSRILAFDKCFHGRTLSMANITDKAAYRDGLPNCIDVDYLPFYNPEHPEKSLQRCLKKLNTLLTRYPNSHAVMILELIQGEGGFNSAPREFFIPLLDTLREHGINIWFDEIQTLGRTSDIFAFHELKLDAYADIVTFGKMAQVCGTLYHKKLKPKPGLISQTYTSSSSAIYAAISTFKFLLEGSLYGDQGLIKKNRDHFLKHFRKLHRKFPKHFNGPHGHGAMISFTYGSGELKLNQELLKALFENGLIAFIAGSQPVKIRFLPPMGCLTTVHIDQACEILEKTIASLIE